jgi:exodeoxyribonuclease-3
MAVHRKLTHLVERLSPDIAVIAECADLATLRAKFGSQVPFSDAAWVGRSPHKGLAVFAFGDFSLVPHAGTDPSLEWILPVHVDGPTPFHLLAVWAMNHRARNAKDNPAVVPQPAAALRQYAAWLESGPTVLAGDFNHNVIWDRRGSTRNHTQTLAACKESGLVSAYHLATGEDQGAETTATLYWRDRRRDGHRYHVDYTFIPEGWGHLLQNVQVGDFEDWVAPGLSDHVPLIVDIARPHL